MGNSCPFHCNLIIHNDIRAIVQFIQATVLFTKHICSKGLAFLHHTANVQLKFGKHGLAVNGALELIQEVIDEIGPFLFIGCLTQEVFHKQCFIAGGSHFRNKDHIVCIHGVLVLVGMIGMECMTHFVGQGKLAVQSAGIVQQNIRVYGCACRVSTASFTHILVNIDPAIVKAFLQDLSVIFA